VQDGIFALRSWRSIFVTVKGHRLIGPLTTILPDGSLQTVIIVGIGMGVGMGVGVGGGGGLVEVMYTRGGRFPSCPTGSCPFQSGKAPRSTTIQYPNWLTGTTKVVWPLLSTCWSKRYVWGFPFSSSSLQATVTTAEVIGWWVAESRTVV